MYRVGSISESTGNQTLSSKRKNLFTWFILENFISWPSISDK
jgi:hypothetical protein